MQHDHDTRPLPHHATDGKRRVTKRGVITTVAVAAAFGIGIGIGAGIGHTTVKTVAGPTVTKNVTHVVPVPGQTKTVTKAVPGPTVTQTKTVYVPASQGPAGTVIATYSGTGTSTTGSFGVPSSGDYITKWSYSGNTDPTLGGGTNFSIQPTNSSGITGNYANDIATSGSGSTEDTGMSGTQSFNVQATGSWTITVTSAP